MAKLSPSRWLEIGHILKRRILTTSMWLASLSLLLLMHQPLPPVQAVSAEVPQSALVVLAQFPEYPYLASRSQISRLFFGTVGHYFSEVSYGKLSLSGNVTDWITLPQVYRQYANGNQFDSEQVARDAFLTASHTFNLTAFGAFILVLSFYPSGTVDYVALKEPIITATGIVRGFSVLEEDSDWTGFARALALSIGLWKVSFRINGLGSLDIAAQGSGDMSAWSKLYLGWINESQVQSYRIPPTRVISRIDAIEQRSVGYYAISINTGIGQYFLEARNPIGYDQLNAAEAGIAVLFVPESNASISVGAVLVPYSVSKSVFLDLASDLSFIALNETKSGFTVLIGSVQDGRDAQRTLYLLSQAESSIQSAEDENRVAGLDLAEQLVNSSQSLFTEGRFQEAAALAASAQTTAQGAVVPPDYQQSLALIAQAENLGSETQGTSLGGQEAIAYGNSELQLAKQSFIAKNFTIARQQAQAAIDAYNRAKQISFSDSILEWVSNLSLVVPVVILVIVLRHQLRSG